MGPRLLGQRVMGTYAACVVTALSVSSDVHIAELEKSKRKDRCGTLRQSGQPSLFLLSLADTCESSEHSWVCSLQPFEVRAVKGSATQLQVSTLACLLSFSAF